MTLDFQSMGIALRVSCVAPIGAALDRARKQADRHHRHRPAPHVGRCMLFAQACHFATKRAGEIPSVFCLDLVRKFEGRLKPITRVRARTPLLGKVRLFDFSVIRGVMAQGLSRGTR
jgi:hypothetical protein